MVRERILSLMCLFKALRVLNLNKIYHFKRYISADLSTGLVVFMVLLFEYIFKKRNTTPYRYFVGKTSQENELIDLIS